MAKNEKEVEILLKKIAKLEKINKALMDRVESSVVSQGSAFSLFEGNILLQKQVKEKTWELEKTKNELLKQKKSLDAVVMISETDVTGKIFNVNKNFCDTTKYSKEELIGKNIKILSSGMHSKEFWKKFWDTINSGFPYKG